MSLLEQPNINKSQIFQIPKYSFISLATKMLLLKKRLVTYYRINKLTKLKTVTSNVRFKKRALPIFNEYGTLQLPYALDI